MTWLEQVRKRVQEELLRQQGRRRHRRKQRQLRKKTAARVMAARVRAIAAPPEITAAAGLPAAEIQETPGRKRRVRPAL